jgi:hypothetical protein
VLALTLVAGVSGAAAARHPDASLWRLPSSFSPCVADCSGGQRIFGAQLRRAEAASMRRRGVASAAAVARPDVTGGGFEGKVTDAKTKAGVTGIEVCAYERVPFEKHAYEKEELEPACAKVTASSGKYQLRVPAGEYFVEFFDPLHNYVTQRYNGLSLAEKPDVVTVVSEGLTPKIDAALLIGGHIEGTLTAASGGAPLEGFLACALDRAVGGFSCAETGSGGKYTIKALPTGTYEVGFFVPPVPGENYLDGLLSGISVTREATTTEVNDALATGGEIRGQVTAAEGGAPLAHIVVCAFLANGEEVEECTGTAADGTYTVERLPTGSYEVAFEAEPEYLTQFYEGAPHLAGAKQIPVTAGGAPVANIDAKMISATAHSGAIEGQVTSAATTSPLASVQVCAIALPAEGAKCTLTAANGDYKIEGLTGGSYGVEFEDQPDYVPQFYNDKAKLSEATPVPVTVGGTAKAINAALVPTGIHHEEGSIEGQVTSAATKTPLAGVEVCAIAPPEELFECAVTEADGDYTIEGLPEGDYKVEFEDEPNYATQFYADKTTLASATPVHVPAGAAAEGIDAAMVPVEHEHHPVDGSIAGRVTAAGTGLPVGGAVVCALPGFGTCALTEPDGSYVIEDLLPGSYKVEFKDGEHFQLQFWNEASSLGGAALVFVGEGKQTSGIDASLKVFVPAQQILGGIVTENTGGSTTPAPGGSVLPAKTVVPSLASGARVHVAGRRASVKLSCSIGPCHGTVQLTITVTRRTRSHGRTVTRHVTVVVGSGAYSLSQGASGKVTVQLTAQGAHLLATASRHPRAGKLKVLLQGASTAVHAVVVS